MGEFAWSLAVFVLLSILWRLSSAVRYFIKWIVFSIVCVVCACCPIPIMLLKPWDSRNALIPAAGLRACSKFLGLKLIVEGQENIVQGSGSVVLINHQSFLDLIVLAMLWPIMDNCTVISKKEIFYMQPFGTAAWLWGTIFIDRVNKKSAQESVAKTGEIIRRRKARVLMFPEGTRNLGKSSLLPFKKGAFHLSLSSGCPIQPVAVARYTFLKGFKFDSGEIRIKILPIIKTEHLSPKDDLENLVNKTYTVLPENVDLLSKQVDINKNGTEYTKKIS